jgi:hypothetical protein
METRNVLTRELLEALHGTLCKSYVSYRLKIWRRRVFERDVVGWFWITERKGTERICNRLLPASESLCLTSAEPRQCEFRLFPTRIRAGFLQTWIRSITCEQASWVIYYYVFSAIQNWTHLLLCRRAAVAVAGLWADRFPWDRPQTEWTYCRDHETLAQWWWTCTNMQIIRLAVAASVRAKCCCIHWVVNETKPVLHENLLVRKEKCVSSKINSWNVIDTSQPVFRITLI